jgi:hypothetical protein
VQPGGVNVAFWDLDQPKKEFQMPNVKSNQKTAAKGKSNGLRSKDDFARDDLTGAFAGNQNAEGKAGASAKNSHLSGRKRTESRDKIPKR